MGYPLSAPSEAMRSSAALMVETKSDITTIIARVMSEVDQMQFMAGSSTTFKNSMESWRQKAQTIVNDLDSMAERLNTSAQQVAQTEDTNVSEAGSIPI
ncbi:WXG100 family type VII secretion target [Dactylosporangium sp. AC04546]|uniref:WXG100 family type VII secretion target n=1 Tax=Dactylosporangium sp. AC04546 TaxID=2862460 RepID=UPI001EE0C6E4|nr:WXG100 family type VII secretion target [Dactylosporangium sp. AC04546]WVK86659.1 WXG100 family type VII secretion target [Dactylosporangium sp. AC04546]